MSRLNDIVPVPNVPIISPAEYYKKINKDPDPNDIYDKQSELGHDELFEFDNLENNKSIY